MSDNGENKYGVSFGRIMFLKKIIEGHDNVKAFTRHDDLVFRIERTEQEDALEIVCVDEYALSEAFARQIVSDFPAVSVIFVGGKWNGATREANAFCREKKVGICNAGAINAVLSKTRYWL